MRRRTRNLGLLAIVAIAAASPLWAPPVLRKASFFAADRVEVSGARLLAPHEVLAASGVRIGENVWTDPAAWEAALRRHPVVAEAEVTRRLPATLRIRVVEKRPAALVQAGVLRPVTADGEVLPVDPARAAVDLPLLQARLKRSESARIGDPAARGALAEAGRLAELDPALMARVSEVRPGEKGETLLRLADPAADVVVPRGIDEPRLARLRAALADVARRMSAADSAKPGRARIDARFDDQVVVRMPE
ncbi:MAG TPA: FtsQ-type POTRA domain-containing protein [Longimicrobium sp.]|nr:FtsQ-type POTRA domain-containing protein [Longimicrobium sp.]